MRILNLFCVLAVAATASSTLAAEKQETSSRDLVAVIQSSSASQKEKADACRELAIKGDKQAVASLARLLVDPELSHMARYALETIPGPAADRALVDALGNVDGRLLAGIIGSIGVRNYDKAVPTLASFLHYRDPIVLQAAARALGSIGGNASVRALQAALPGATGDNRLAIAEGLLRAAEKLIENKKIEAAMKVYDGLRTAELPHQLRTAALRGAAMTRGENARSLLVEALRGDDFTQAAAAARIAQFLTPREITQALVTELPKLAPDRQILVIHALARRGDKMAVPALVTVASTGGEKRVRIEAIRALPQLGESSVNPALMDLIGNTDAELARAAQEALAALPGPAVDKAVMSLITGTATQKRLTGFDLAARRRMTSAMPFLMKAASDSDAQVRAAAVRRIGELASPQDLPALLDMLTAAKAPADVESVENAVAAVSVRSVNKDEAVERLAARLAQAQPAQKAAILRVMTSLGGQKALQHVSAALQDANPQVRSAAVRALGNWSTPDSAPHLLNVASTSQAPTERLIALRGYLGLARLADVPEDKRLQMCQEAGALVSQPEEKRMLLGALSQITAPGSLQLIAAHLEDATVKEEAANAAISVSERLLKRPDAAQNSALVTETLSKAAAATSNKDLAARAAKLVEEAKAKGEQK